MSQSSRPRARTTLRRSLSSLTLAGLAALAIQPTANALTTEPDAPAPDATVASDSPVAPEAVPDYSQTVATAAVSTRVSFLKKVVPLAQETQREYAIPASVTIAQAILETGWGASEVGGGFNNFFGVKCFNGKPGPIAIGCRYRWTWEDGPKGKRVVRTLFRVYATLLDSFRDHADFLVPNGRAGNTLYRPCFLYIGSPFEFAVELKRAGYATDRNYANSLITLMKDNNLRSYDVYPAEYQKLPMLSRGVNKPVAVRTLQYFLRMRGYNIPVTGVFAGSTEAVVRQFQREHGIPATGNVAILTWTSLIPRLDRGGTGEPVKALQVALNAKGYKLPVNGSFGPQTEVAVKAWQKKQGLPTTGVAAGRTWAALLS